MKALTLTLIAATAQLSLCAQHNDVFASNHRVPHSTAAGEEVRRETVNANLEPTGAANASFTREARRTSEGWEVKVKCAGGNLRMEGTYSDEKLTVQNGIFHYYHDNGRLESEGAYVNGVKSGVWKRYDRDGNALAERVYSGQTYEQMAAEHGWSAPATKK